MPEEEAQPRVLTPFMKFSQPGPNFKDLSPHIKESDEEEVEEVLTPAPKDSSAQESVTSSESQQSAVQVQSETPALPDQVLPTEKLEAAVRASGKDSESNEDEPQPPKTTEQSPEDSSQSSSSKTSPGKPTPPVAAKPPTSA